MNSLGLWTGSQKDGKKKEAPWLCLRNVQPTHVSQCLVDKHITICASGPRLSVKMGLRHVRGTKTIVTERRLKASHNKSLQADLRAL